MPQLSRRTLMSLMPAAAFAALLARPASAGKPPVFAASGVAIRGTDPVAYFTMGKPVAGQPAYASIYNGATWHFASAANKAAFDANPAKFAPQYGGYCAYAVSKGSAAPTDPNAWTIVSDKLYLNFSLDVRQIWGQDIPGNIKAANANWPSPALD